MITKEYEGKTREEALESALKDLGKSIDEVEVEYLDEEKKVGFFGFRANRSIRIRVSYAEEESEVSVKAQTFLNKIFSYLNVEADLAALQENDELLTLRIASDASGLIIGRHGSTLEALQFITNVVANKGRGTNNWIRILLDAEGYRDKREDQLKRLAHRASYTATQKRLPVLLEPLNPAERRIIHLALQERDDVQTESEGDGLLKRVRIDPLGEFAPAPDATPYNYVDQPREHRGGPGGHRGGGGRRGGGGPRPGGDRRYSSGGGRGRGGQGGRPGGGGGGGRRRAPQRQGGGRPNYRESQDSEVYEERFVAQEEDFAEQQRRFAEENADHEESSQSPPPQTDSDETGPRRPRRRRPE